MGPLVPHVLLVLPVIMADLLHILHHVFQKKIEGGLTALGYFEAFIRSLGVDLVTVLLGVSVGDHLHGLLDSLQVVLVLFGRQPGGLNSLLPFLVFEIDDVEVVPRVLFYDLLEIRRGNDELFIFRPVRDLVARHDVLVYSLRYFGFVLPPSFSVDQLR